MNSNLDIENASIGYNEAGMTQVYNDIKANLIDDVIELLNANVPTLAANVDGYWKGLSADNFKTKILKDNETVVKALTQVGESLKTELDQMMYNTNNSDATVAEQIAAQTNN